MYSTKDLQIRGSPIDGLGIFAFRAIPARTHLLEYVGKRLTLEEYAAWPDKTFCFMIDGKEVLDGTAMWNPARFINHSCKPNCESRIIEGAVWIVTRRDIAAREELTFNYGYPLEDFRQRPCRCGAAGCVGYMVAEEFFPTLQRMRQNGELNT
jgi:SET domain-containing protein